MEELWTEWLPFGLGLITILFSYLIYLRLVTVSEIKKDIPSDTKETKAPQKILKLKKSSYDKRKEVKDTFTHPWLLTNLKGHVGEILDMDISTNGKHLITCDDDHAVFLWNVKTLAEKKHKCVRTNVDYDHGTRVKWSPDGKAFIISLAIQNTVQVYKVTKRKDGMLGDAEGIIKFKTAHKADILNIGIACNGLFIMSCSSDTTIRIWDLKGELLSTIDTHNMNNFFARVSYCGRFIASSGFTPDVKVWEVCFTKLGEFQAVKRVYELKGHTSGIYHFDFSNDSSRMATLSKDNTWKLWDTNIEYSKGQEPYLLHSGSYSTTPKSLIALSPDGKTFSIASASDVSIYSGVSGNLQAKILAIYPEGHINSLSFTPDGLYLMAAVGRYVRIFYNVPGYENIILSYEEAMKTPLNISMKDRLQSQIDKTKLLLKAVKETIKNQKEKS